MKNKYLLGIGIGLIVLGLYQSVNVSIPSISSPCQTLKIDAPPEGELRELAQDVIQSWRDGSSDRSIDGQKLASLYNDISILIALDTDSIVNSTNAIREANILSARLLKINLKDKYPGLAESMSTLLKVYVSDQDVQLDDSLRQKSSEAFAALAWACLEGSK